MIDKSEKGRNREERSGRWMAGGKEKKGVGVL